jgi:hypothetical protein
MNKGSHLARIEQQNYSLFLKGLDGVQDDAGIECYSQDGIRLLREALEAFLAEYRDRFGK